MEIGLSQFAIVTSLLEQASMSSASEFHSFFGLYLIISSSGNGIALGSQTLFGDLLMMSGAIAWALYSVLSRPLLMRYSSTTYTTWTMAAGTPLIVLAGIPDLLQTNFAAVPPMSWLIMIFSATLAISVGYIIWNMGIHRLGQARAATYSNITPLVAIVVGTLFLYETITPMKLLGAAVVLVGVTLTRRG